MFRNTAYFTVFGGAYVPERRSAYRFDIDRKARRTNLTAPLLVAYTLVLGISLLAVELSQFTAGAQRLFGG